MTNMETLRHLVAKPELTVAPLVLNPLMARMAEDAGFKALYLGGGSLGWLQCVTEANITLPEMASVAVAIRTVCRLPIVLDAGGGWGDPAHMHRTVGLSEAAGFAAIEIEDQVLPRRFHHHVGQERLVPTEFMVARVKECVAARRSDMMIIARTNATRTEGIEAAVRKAEAFHKAGADMLFVHTRTAEDIRFVGERLPAPLMIFAPEDGFAGYPLSRADMAGLGFRFAASSGSAFAAMYKAVAQSYACLARDEIDPFLGKGGTGPQMKLAHKTYGLDRMLEIEKRTTGA
jgi:2-methylisocitrate lyase-like PEP mutase family enzyme